MQALAYALLAWLPNKISRNKPIQWLAVKLAARTAVCGPICYDI